MKIKKSQLRRIIAEESARLNEMNKDGTISPDEEDEENILAQEVYADMKSIIAKVRAESDRIGGSFRSPGIRSRVLAMIARQLHGAR